jgi:hypothetical protein
MYSLAENRDLVSLLAMKQGVWSGGSRVLVDNYSVALYVADNRRFKEQFLSDFPIDTQGFEDLGCGTSSVNRGFDPYETLDKLALAGDAVAIRKALLVETDGAVAEETTDNATRIAAKYPHTSLRQLTNLSGPQRARVICSNMDDYYEKADFDRFLATKPTSTAETALLIDLRAIHSRCRR